MAKSKKSQEEIMGFIIIVAMVVILGVLLVFFMKPKTAEEKDFQTENLLYSIIGTTIESKTIGERIEGCEKGEECELLKRKLNELLDLSFSKAGYVLGKNIKGYKLSVTEGMEYSYSKGNVTARSIASATVVKSSTVKLKVYY